MGVARNRLSCCIMKIEINSWNVRGVNDREKKKLIIVDKI